MPASSHSKLSARPGASTEAPLGPPRLEVRLGVGRPTTYELLGDEFLIGGALGCDLRLAGANLPPVAAQFLRDTADGGTLHIRRLTPTAQILRNGVPRPTTDPYPLAEGDTLQIGPATIVVRLPVGAYFTPRLILAEEELASVPLSVPAPVPVSRSEELELKLIREKLEQDQAAFRAADADRLRREDQWKEDLQRLHRWQSTLEERQQKLDRRATEVDARMDQLRYDASELEEQVRLAEAEQLRLIELAERLQTLREELDERERIESHEAAARSALEANLAVTKANLDRQQDEARREFTQLAMDRARLEATRAELDERLHAAQQLQAELGHRQHDTEARSATITEQHRLLTTTLDDIQQQKDAVATEEARLRQKELDLDTRSAEIAEQTAMLKARVMQVMEYQERLEADRLAVRQREASLAEAELARQTLQEQLRRRAEDLNQRAAHLEAQQKEFLQARAELDELRTRLDRERLEHEDDLIHRRRILEQQTTTLAERAAALAERETHLQRQVARLREVGQTVAAERKTIAESRQLSTAEQQQFLAWQEHAAGTFAQLRSEVPQLEQQAATVQQQLQSAREVLRGQLGEVQTYALGHQIELEQLRSQLATQATELQSREQTLERARAEHRHAVAEFRQQMLDWQAAITELRQSMTRSESTLETRQASLEETTRAMETARETLAQQEVELAAQRQIVAEKRSEMDRHLSDMREWYRRKLRELAAGQAVDDSDMPRLQLIAPGPGSFDELDPGDRQLGELLQSRGLIDADTLQSLWQESRRQRRTLRQVLLTSGTLTLYQLATIESGNLDALMLGRFRIIDRIRTNPRETVYRVLDPTRLNETSAGVVQLRVLGETDTQDALRPDEFRQRFAAAMMAHHPNLHETLEILEIQGRPAVLQEWLVGLPSEEWPAAISTPGVWLQLLTQAARGIHHAHRSGLVHGRLAPASFVLQKSGLLRIVGFGEPPWLYGPATLLDPMPQADLRSLGQAAYSWNQRNAKKRTVRTKPFPAELMSIVHRLESNAEPSMGDVVGFDRAYSDAGELLQDLARFAEEYPLPADGWEKLTRALADALTLAPLRASA
ncbi:MAG: hypothetical protein ACRCZF_22755 [Gemmataceae bacterium]